MAVRDQNSAEAVMRHALRHIEHKIHQMLNRNVDRAREIHVMRLVSEGNNRHQQDIAFSALRSCLADTPDQEIIHIQRQMRTVVLNGTDRQDNYGLPFCDLTEFRPGVVLVQVVFTSHGGQDKATDFRGSITSHSAAPSTYSPAAA